ncbi:hypothetical protein C465_00097 [Halorubrum distributum JCM 9100]|uniref:Uncharacterized protein n=2 Tax=Halorubrum distributum TaxID=29283 RepID=M0F2K0_9EURY|nr:hypothetical protein [Halorubrum distributum]ELZ54140.1 hypothetical protein C465_00097 [Halorubrum distributum JCM 9100]ELZ54400.1 hypothetical protein C466_06177 [Halorubrum distributum JCM 10118]
MKRRTLILLLGGASSGAMSIGTGAFSSMEAERNVSVNVEDDEDAYIRYEKPSDGKTVEYGEQVTLVRVRNQFGGNQDLALVGVEYEYEDEDREDDVLRNVAVERYDSPAAPDETLSDEDFTDVDDDHVAIERGSTNGNYPAANESDAFGPGEWVRIVADAHVPAGDSPDIEVTITIEGVKGGISAQLFGETRAFSLTGAEDVSASQTPTVDFKGSSDNAKLDGAESGVLTRVWYRDESEGEETLENREENLSNGQIRNQLFNGSEKSDKRIVAVSLTDLNRTYVREGDELNPGSSVCYEGVPGSEDEFDLDTLSACD